MNVDLVLVPTAVSLRELYFGRCRLLLTCDDVFVSRHMYGFGESLCLRLPCWLQWISVPNRGIFALRCTVFPSWHFIDRVRRQVNECASAPCRNGGSCVDLLVGWTCQCAPGYSGQTCE